MKTKEVTIGNQSFVNVTMEEESIGLDEVVAVGYGTQKKVNLTGSVSVITTEDFETRSIASTSVALQGISPGVTVTTNSGAPGSVGNIRIRGIGTLNNADPLVLIDGVEGDLNVIDPSMIESMSVLKDAASSAIYGSRAANGVILITTKRAQGDVLSITYNGYVGVQQPTDLPDKVDAIDHMLMLNTAYENSGATPLYTDSYINEYRQNMNSDPDHYPNTDWQKEVLKGSGMMQNHNLTLNAGSKKIRTLTSLGYLDQKGIIKQSGYERYSIRNNADIMFSDKLNMRFDIQIINKNTLAPGTAGEVASDGLSEVFLQMNRIPTVQPGLYSNGIYGEGWNGNNPIAFSTADGGFFKNNHLSLLGSISLNYSPVKWLTAEVLAAPKFNESNSRVFNKSVTTYQADGSVLFVRPEKSTLTNANNRSFYGNYYASLTANQKFNGHEIKVMVGSSLETFLNRNFSAYRDVFVFPITRF